MVRSEHHQSESATTCSYQKLYLKRMQRVTKKKIVFWLFLHFVELWLNKTKEDNFFVFKVPNLFLIFLIFTFILLCTEEHFLSDRRCQCLRMKMGVQNSVAKLDNNTKFSASQQETKIFLRTLNKPVKSMTDGSARVTVMNLKWNLKRRIR